MSWKTVELGDVCEFTRGLTYSKIDEVEFSNNAVLRATNIDLKSNKLNLEEIRYINSSVKIKEDKKVKLNDILICTASGSKSHLGKVALINEQLDMAFGGFMAVLRAKENIEAKFLFNYLTSDIFLNHISRLADGANINNLKFSQIQNLKFNLPSISTQQKIVAKLDAIFVEIDTARAAAEANTKNVETLFQSYLTEIYEHDREGWNKKKICEIAKIKGGKRVPKGYELKNEITPYVYLRVTNFSENGEIDTTDLRYVDGDVWSGIKNYIINSEDLYVSIAGTIGRTGIVSDQLSGSLLTENACRLVFNNDINNRFIYYFTKSSSFINQTVEQTRTTAQPKLALSRLGEITLAIPSLDEQLEINKKLDLMASQISIYKNSYEQKIIELNALKQAILQKAFSGELVKD